MRTKEKVPSPKLKESILVDLGATITALTLAPSAGRKIGSTAREVSDWIKNRSKKNV